jgi:hypothetical protein
LELEEDPAKLVRECLVFVCSTIPAIVVPGNPVTASRAVPAIASTKYPEIAVTECLAIVVTEDLAIVL